MRNQLNRTFLTSLNPSICLQLCLNSEIQQSEKIGISFQLNMPWVEKELLIQTKVLIQIIKIISFF